MSTTGFRDTLCNLKPLGIPRPTIKGLKFIPTKGRMGFYKTIKQEGEKYGVSIKNQGPRRPALPGADFWKQNQEGTDEKKESREGNREEKDINENNNNEKMSNYNQNDEASDIVGELKPINRSSLKDFNYNHPHILTPMFSKMSIIEEGYMSPPEVPEPDYEDDNTYDNHETNTKEQERYPKTIISPVQKFMERNHIINKINTIKNNDNYNNKYHMYHNQQQDMGQVGRNQGLPPFGRSNHHYWNNGHHFNYQNTLVQKL
uniref:Homeobox protein 2-like n=1 Tax=Strongyloides papillosus TaxID=174720 RepID=A0A0N5BG37_STREA